MKNLFYLVLIAFSVASCQIDLMKPADNGETVVPDLNARIARKLFVGGNDGKTVLTEEKYEYNASNQLIKLSRLSRNAANKMELYAYEQYAYNSSGQLEQKQSFSRNGSSEFLLYSMSQYAYPSAGLVQETVYYVDQRTQMKTPQSQTETVLEGGVKVKETVSYTNGKTLEKARETTYRYEAGRLIAEDIRYPNSPSGTVFRYVYKGRTARVEEFMGNRAESISEQAFQYDSRGRLIRQEVLKTNPLLCVAMFPGSATVYEYAD